MKRYFVAYKHTGEVLEELEKRISTVTNALATKKIQAYATLFDEGKFQSENQTAGQIMETAFQKISAMDGLFVLIAGAGVSEGQLMEVGYALAIKKPIIVAYQEDVKTYVNQLANISFSYSDLNDLSKKIMELDL